jgi:hypothetical protein
MRLSKKITAVFPIPNDPDKGEVTLVYLTPGEVEDLQEEMGAFDTVMRRGEGGTLEPEMRQNPKLGDKRYLLTCAAVESWRNIKDAEGRALPCNEETKLMVARSAEITKENGEVVGFPTWINECRAGLAKIVRKDKEAAEKN